MESINLKLRDLQPSQFYISEKKLAEVEQWLSPGDLSNFAPIPVKWLDGRPVMTDGHTRAVAALRAGLEQVPLALEEDELSWDMYRRCVAACRERGILSPLELQERIISEQDYKILWDAWCDDMQREIITERAMAYVQALFAENAGGHDADHTLRVYRAAMEIADSEPGCDKEVVALAALLHDADDHKLFQTVNNANARRFLEENHIPAGSIDLVCEAINSVSFSKNRGKTPRTLEGKIVRDADRLDALGAIGIARTFAYGGEHGRSMADSLQHFYDKLLLLKDLMHTEKGRQLAEKRHAFLEAFLEEWKEESAGKSAPWDLSPCCGNGEKDEERH